MCFSNMAYAFGLSPPMAAVLGKVYTPVLALGERVVLKKRRKGVEWIAVIILTLGTFTFLYLQMYDFEEGLSKAMKNMFPLILCIAGACASAFQALVSQGIYEANRDVDFYMNKVRFDAGSAVFTLLAVTKLLKLPSTAWKVSSLANGGSLHFPWSMEESMLTCKDDVCTGVCSCQSGIFAGWGLQPALYAFLAISVIYGILVGIIYDKYGSLHRAKCDAFGLLLTYWFGNPLLDYLVEGKSFGASLSDVCLNIVSFIVPLAALATDFGKIMTTKMLQKVCSYRMGLVIVDLIDQRAGDMRKQGARVRLVDEQMVSARWKSKLTQLLNSLPSHQKHEYHQLIDEMDSDPGMSVPTRVAIGVRTWAANHHMVSMASHQKHEYHQLIDEMDSDPGMSVPTRVAIGVRTWAANHHMVSMARHGIRASADGHCHIRSLGFQEINVCKDRVGPSRTERSSGDPTGSDRF
eukprot:g20992.t1